MLSVVPTTVGPFFPCLHYKVDNMHVVISLPTLSLETVTFSAVSFVALATKRAYLSALLRRA